MYLRVLTDDHKERTQAQAHLHTRTLRCGCREFTRDLTVKTRRVQNDILLILTVIRSVFSSFFVCPSHCLR